MPTLLHTPPGTNRRNSAATAPSRVQVPSGGVVLGLSKLARATKCLAARVQSQGAFTRALLAAVEAEVAPRGVAVVVQAAHLGAGASHSAPAPAVATSVASGVFLDPGSGLMDEFLALLRLAGVCGLRGLDPAAGAAAAVAAEGDSAPEPPAAPCSTAAATAAPCSTAAATEAAQAAATLRQEQRGQLLPASSLSSLSSSDDDGISSSVCAYSMADACPADAAMVEAAAALLEGVGEDPSCPALADACRRYVSWLHAATAGYRMALPCATDLGPATPGFHTPDRASDASSDECMVPAECFQTGSDKAGAMGDPCCACCTSGGGGDSLRAAGTVGAADAAEAAAAAATAGGIVTFSTHFASQCEHHLLPFHGELLLAYMPGTTSCSGGSSESASSQQQQQPVQWAPRRSCSQEAALLSQVVEMYSRRLQVQERLTNQVAEAAAAALGAAAVLVVVDSTHMCMVARGVEKHSSTTLTTAARGAWALRGGAAGRAAALELLMTARCKGGVSGA